MIIRLAWRSIWRNKRRTLITVGSIAFGLTIAVFFISLGEGMYGQLIDQAVRIQAGHVTLEHPEYGAAPAVDLYIRPSPEFRAEVESWPEVEITKLIVLGQSIAKSGSGNVAAAIMGVEPRVERTTSAVARNMEAGEYLREGDARRVVIGAKMAERLNLKVGKKMVLSTNDVNGDLVEELCRVKGIFRTGSEEIDAYFIQVPLSFARRLYRLPEGGATQMGVILRNADDQGRVLRAIHKKVDRPVAASRERAAGGREMVALPWQEVMPEMASWIRMDMGFNYVFQAILIFLILFTIFNTILMSVLERRREFAMLLALGTEPAHLRRQVFVESLFLGLVGCVIGLALGGLASTVVSVYGIDLKPWLEEGVSISGFAMSTRLYTRVTAGILFGSGIIVLAATMLLSLIPSRRATGVNIVDALR